MRRTEQLQGLRLMKFEDVYGRCYRGDLSQAGTSEILGMSERTFRRWRERYEAEGAEGLYDRRLGRVSARRAPVDEVMRVLELFETRYPDFTAKHFHEKLVCEHGFGLSYNPRSRSASFAMVSAITGEIVSNANSKANPTAFWATARANATSWSKLMNEKAPAKASMPPQPARKEGRLPDAICSERTGARR